MKNINEQQSQIITYFTDPLLLNYITSYLNISDKLKLTILNKKIRYIMQDHFRMILNENKLHTITNKSSIHQMRFYFDRCLRIFKHNKDKDIKQQSSSNNKRKQSYNNINLNQQLKITIQNPFKFNVITYFQVGINYTAFIDHLHRAFIFKTNHLLSLLQQQKKSIYRIENQIKQIKCKGQKLIILKLNGQIIIWQTDKKIQQIYTKINKLQWTIHLPIKNIYSSFNYTIFILENPFQSRQIIFKYIFNYDYNLHKDNQNHHPKYYLIALNIQTNAFYVINIPAKNIIHLTVGHKQAYLINQHHQCYIVQFDLINQGQKQINAKIFQPLAQKRIIKIFGGYNFFFALERNIQYIQQWTTQEVIIWMRNIGFTDYIKIARAQKINGINKLNMQQKFILCIQQVIQGKNEYDQLWIWGKNDYGQLGINYANYISQPFRLKMDFIKQKDRIDNIFCGWYQTFIRTHRGKIYQTIINIQKKKKKYYQQKQIDISDQEIKKQNQEIFKYKNKKRKKIQDIIINDKKNKQHHKKYQQEIKWIQSIAGKAFFVQSYKNYIFYIQCPDQNKFEPSKQKKLRTSKAIIDRILWDQSLNKSQFKIGLIDKDMGTIQVTLNQIQAFDYKQTSIRYVKRNKNIVWDRQNKIDHL